MKPLTKEKIVKLLTKLSKRRTTEATFLMIEFNQMPMKIYLYDIMYIEAVGHYVQIVTQEKTLQCKSSLHKIMQELSPIFIQVHRSYVVNINFILAVHQKDVILSDHTPLPVSRNQKRKVKELFLAHYRGLAND